MSIARRVKDHLEQNKFLTLIAHIAWPIQRKKSQLPSMCLERKWPRPLSLRRIHSLPWLSCLQ